MFKKFFIEGSKESSMRLFLLLGMACIMLLCIGVFTYITIHAIKCSVIVDWAGMSIFIGSIAAFAGTLLYGKVQQKKVEVSQSTEEK